MKTAATVLSTILAVGIASSDISSAYAEDDATTGIEAVIAENYQQTVREIEQQRKKFHQEYIHAQSSQERQNLIFKAQNYLFNVISDQLVPPWYGTFWTFTGTSDTPQQGTISCGHFVSTILEHAGFNLERLDLGQLHAGNIILNINDNPENVRIYKNKDLAVVEEEVQQWGKGIYLVGLDTHTGFIINDGQGTINFVHSSYYADKKVVSEPLQGNNPFHDSKYRVIGKVLDETVAKQWIFNEQFPLTYTTPDDYRRVERKVLQRQEYSY
ncbi:MAG: hypothetical protein Q8R37_02490 [Nanoarchaeota archaeon]|nr:hypothetical protein [Nanoarchaeota archaeon]